LNGLPAPTFSQAIVIACTRPLKAARTIIKNRTDNLRFSFPLLIIYQVLYLFQITVLNCIPITRKTVMIIYAIFSGVDI
jgi:hypothetical protein